MCEIIGRKKEIKILDDCYQSGQPEFIAIYGRRRIGKTFLVSKVYGDNITFSHTGLAPTRNRKKNSLKNQLQNFYFSLLRAGAQIEDEPQSWLEAFYLLQCFLKKVDNGNRQVVFIDEVSWMDTPRSNFTSALESFWNGWGNRRNNLVLIICSSATSWMLVNVVNDANGFYKRLTETIHLKPFNLSECEEYFHRKGFKMTRDDILQAYMILGGVPYYLNLFRTNLSLAQNIDNLFYGKEPKLCEEYDYLFSSIFHNDDSHKAIIELLAKRRTGYTKKEIAQKLDINDNGEFYKMLTALEKSNFLTEYNPVNCNSKISTLRLSDPFCLFWLHFYKSHRTDQDNYWSMNMNTAPVKTWQGYAFEDVCFNHELQIKKALGIEVINTEISSLAIQGDEEREGIQIDMLIKRADNVINMCEMKYSKTDFAIDKDYSRKLFRRMEILSDFVKNKNIHLTLISPHGIKRNEYSGDIQSVLDIDDLFLI